MGQASTKVDPRHSYSNGFDTLPDALDADPSTSPALHSKRLKKMTRRKSAPDLTDSSSSSSFRDADFESAGPSGDHLGLKWAASSVPEAFRDRGGASLLPRAPSTPRTPKSSPWTPSGHGSSRRGYGYGYGSMGSTGEGVLGSVWRGVAAASNTTVDFFAAAVVLALVTGLLNFFLLGQPIPNFGGLSQKISALAQQSMALVSLRGPSPSLPPPVPALGLGMAVTSTWGGATPEHPATVASASTASTGRTASTGAVTVGSVSSSSSAPTAGNPAAATYSSAASSAAAADSLVTARPATVSTGLTTDAAASSSGGSTQLAAVAAAGASGVASGGASGVASGGASGVASGGASGVASEVAAAVAPQGRPGLVKFGSGNNHPLYYRNPEGCGPVYDPVDFFKARSFKKITWRPQPDKFLFAYCFRGQISNRILCFRNTMILAALLNRTLVVPIRTTEQLEHVYDFRLIFHLDSARQCLGHDTVMSSDEFEAKYGGSLQIDRLQCWHGPNMTCPATPGKKDKDCPGLPMPGEALNSSLPVNMSLLGVPTRALALDKDSHMAQHFVRGSGREGGIPVQGLCLGSNISFEDAVRVFGKYQDRMLSVGDMVDRFLEDPLLHLPFLELVFNLMPTCQTWKGSILSPAPQLLSRSYLLQKRLFGEEEYMAVHWRRGDFALYCFNAVKSSSCFYSPRQGANCTLRLAQKFGLKKVFLATNAPEDELKVYLDYIREQSGGTVEVKQSVRLWEDPRKQEAWLKRVFPGGNITEQSSLAEATNQKLICARSRVFVGAQESTFTRDIMHLRFAMRNINCDDQLLCYQEPEWEDDYTGLSEKELEMKLDWKKRTAAHLKRMKEKEEREKRALEAAENKRKEEEKREKRGLEAEKKRKEEEEATRKKRGEQVKVVEAKSAVAEPVKTTPMLD